MDVFRELPFHQTDISDMDMELASTSSGYESAINTTDATIGELITSDADDGRTNIPTERSPSTPVLLSPTSVPVRKNRRSLSTNLRAGSESDVRDCSAVDIAELMKGISDLVFHSLPPSPSSSSSCIHADVSCKICYRNAGDLEMSCCEMQVCSACLTDVVRAKLADDVTTIPCPVPSCNANISEAQIQALLTENEEVWQCYAQADASCRICYCNEGDLEMSCCELKVCSACLTDVVRAKLADGVTTIPCPGSSCTANIEEAQIRALLTENEELWQRYMRYKVAQGNSVTEKLCPFCSHITVHRLHVGKPKNDLRESDVRINCGSCLQDWCFVCHAPWHVGIKCKDLQAGSKMFKRWMKGKDSRGQANAQRCPNCKVPIQRSTGCDNMHCNRCKTRFCYRCGGYFKRSFVLGKHYKPLSPYGCKGAYRGSPVERETVRYGYLFAKATFLAAYPLFFIGAAGVVLVGGTVYLMYKGGRMASRKIKASR